MRLERKAVVAAPESGLLDADAETGVVEALVSVTGVVDNDGDIIEPGSYTETLVKRRPKGIFAHDWARWASRTEVVEEWMPGDPRLPDATKDGKPWPKEAGALYVKTRYNLETDNGKNAYHDVTFFSQTGECEWSIGYRVPKGKSTRDKAGIRRIKSVDLFEYSPVLFGANSMSGTLSVKSAQSDDGETDGDEADYEPVEEKAWLERLHPRDGNGKFGNKPGGGDPVHDWHSSPAGVQSLREHLGTTPDEEIAKGGDRGKAGALAQDNGWTPGIAVGGGRINYTRGNEVLWVRYNEGGGKAPAFDAAGYFDHVDEREHGLGSMDEVTKYLKGDGVSRPKSLDLSENALLEVDDALLEADDALLEAEGDEEAISQLEADPAEGKAVFDLTPPRLGDPFDVFREFRNMNVPDIADTTMRDRMQATLFRVGDLLSSGNRSLAQVELEIFLGQLHDAKANPEIRSFTERAIGIVQRASTAAAEITSGQKLPGKAMAHESLNHSPKKNWVEMAGQLPAYIQHIANDLHQQKGMPLDKAIPTAIAAVKKWAAGGGNVNPDTRAKATQAVAEWEALKAKAKAARASKSETLEAEPGGGKEVEESSRFPYFPGTYEEIREQIREETSKALAVDHVELVGTWPDYAVVSAYQITTDGVSEAKAYQVPYTVDAGEPATVTIGEPSLVLLSVSVDDGEEEPSEKMLPFPSMLEDATVGLAALLAHGENKAGRVLSGVNETRLRTVVEQLVALLRSAGIDIKDKPVPGDTQPDGPSGGPIATDSTAPSAQARKVMDPDLLARAYRIQAEAAMRR